MTYFQNQNQPQSFREIIVAAGVGGVRQETVVAVLLANGIVTAEQVPTVFAVAGLARDPANPIVTKADTEALVDAARRVLLAGRA